MCRALGISGLSNARVEATCPVHASSQDFLVADRFTQTTEVSFFAMIIQKNRRASYKMHSR